MSERIILGAVTNSPDTDGTGYPNTNVNLLDRFLAMSESVDLGQRGMNVEKAKRMLIGGLVIDIEAANDYPKLHGLVEEMVAKRSLTRKFEVNGDIDARLFVGQNSATKGVLGMSHDQFMVGVHNLRRHEYPKTVVGLTVNSPEEEAALWQSYDEALKPGVELEAKSVRYPAGSAAVRATYMTAFED